MKMPVLLVVIASLFAQEVAGVTPQRKFPVGSTNIVEHYDSTNSNFGTFTFFCTNMNGIRTNRTIVHSKLAFTNKAHLDAYYQLQLRADIETIRADPAIDKTKPITVASFFDRGEINYWMLSASNQFSFVISNGLPVTPNLSYIVPRMGDWLVPIGIKNLKWGRIEVKSSGPGQSSVSPGFSFITDSRYNTGRPSAANNYTAVEIMPLPYFGVCSIGIPFACSGQNGPYKLKITTVSGTGNDFEIFDESGNAVPETPLRIENLTYGSNIQMDVVGGDVGRVFAILSSTNLINWKAVAGTTNVVTSEGKVRVTFPKTAAPRMFFRAMTINMSPSLLPLPSLRIENPRSQGSSFDFDVIGGDVGSGKFVIEKSTDAKTWTQLSITNAVSGLPVHISVPKGTEPKAFFRAKKI